MKKTLLSAVLLSASALVFSGSALAKTDLLVNPITGAVEGTAKVISTTASDVVAPVASIETSAPTMSYRTGWWQKTSAPASEYIVTNMNTGAQKVLWSTMGHKRYGTVTCDSPMFSGICSGTKYTITNVNTGKEYLVTKVRHGTMDVMTGNGRVIRYQYVDPSVRPL